MSKYLKLLFVFILVFSAYHLFRDIVSEILGISHPIVDFGHRDYTGENWHWCLPCCQWLTFPFEIFNIIGSLIVLKRGKMGYLGLSVLATLPIGLVAYLRGEGPFF